MYRENLCLFNFRHKTRGELTSEIGKKSRKICGNLMIIIRSSKNLYWEIVIWFLFLENTVLKKSCHNFSVEIFPAPIMAIRRNISKKIRTRFYKNGLYKCTIGIFADFYRNFSNKNQNKPKYFWFSLEKSLKKFAKFRKICTRFANIWIICVGKFFPNSI